MIPTTNKTMKDKSWIFLLLAILAFVAGALNVPEAFGMPQINAPSLGWAFISCWLLVSNYKLH
jgi:hypothetical protein